MEKWFCYLTESIFWTSTITLAETSECKFILILYLPILLISCFISISDGLTSTLSSDIKAFETSLGFIEPYRSPLSLASLLNFKTLLFIFDATSLNFFLASLLALFNSSFFYLPKQYFPYLP